VALRRNNPVINNRVERFAIARNVDRFAVAKNVDRFAVAKNVDRFAVAKTKVLRKLHLAFASPGFLSAPAKALALPDSPALSNNQLYPERKASPNKKFAPPARSYPDGPLL
jgi:hypothetical protein